MRGRGNSAARARERGAALAELALAFPVHLAAVLGIVQWGHLSVGRAFTEYAAYAAARAALVEPASRGARRARHVDPVAAARTALLPLAGGSLRSGPFPAGALAMFDPARRAATARRARVTVSRARGRVRAAVAYDFALVVPVVNRFFAWGLRTWGASGGAVPVPSFPSGSGFPIVRLEAECVLPR